MCEVVLFQSGKGGKYSSLTRVAKVVLFCFVWLAALGVPVVASGTAADTFRRVVEAP